MSRMLIDYGDTGYAHEGYAAQILDDDSITGTYSHETEPRMTDQVVAACDCATTTGPFGQNAERVTLAEREHTHAGPTLQRLQLEELDRLGEHLRTFASYSATLAPHAGLDLLGHVLADLTPRSPR